MAAAPARPGLTFLACYTGSTVVTRTRRPVAVLSIALVLLAGFLPGVSVEAFVVPQPPSVVLDESGPGVVPPPRRLGTEQRPDVAAVAAPRPPPARRP